MRAFFVKLKILLLCTPSIAFRTFLPTSLKWVPAIDSSHLRLQTTSVHEKGDAGEEIHSGDGLDFESYEDEEGEQTEEELVGEEQLLQETYNTLSESISASLEFYSKKSNSLNAELEKARQYEEMMHHANLLTANLYQIPAGAETITVIDWENDNKEIELTLDTQKYATAQEEANALFTKARKMKRGSNVIVDLLAKNEEAVAILLKARDQMDRLMDEDDPDQIKEEKLLFVRDKLLQNSKSNSIKFSLPEDSQPKLPHSEISKRRNTSQTQFRTFFSPSGHKILVGRNRKENEKICFQVARSNDLWLHARGVPGAHVLIFCRRGDPKPTQECLDFAANLAAFYSESRREAKTDVTIAEPKHILKPRGAPPGAVKLRQELKTIVGNPFNVPEELILLRGSDSVELGNRSQGIKAKNKKWTADMRKRQKLERKEKRKQKQMD